MDMFAAYALLPLFLHFLSRSIEKNSWKEGIKAGTILGLIGLAGAWYAIYWGIFVAFIIMGFSYFRKRKTLNLKAIIGLSISFLIIIGWKIASIFIYQIEMIRNNVHRGAVPVLEVVERTINPYELVVHHVPGPLSPEYISLGLIILALAVVGVTALRWHWAVLSMFFFLIYSQEYGNILNDIILTFGLTGFFPDMERAIIMLNLFLILLAVSGLDSLIKKKEHDFAISFIFAFAVIEFAAVMFIFSLQLFPSIGTVFLAVTVVVTSIYLFFTSNSLNKTKFIAGISLFGSLLIFTIMMNSFPQEIPAYSEEKNQIANKVIAETHNDWIFLSKEVYIDGLLTHEMLKEGGRIVNPYNGYHFENDFSCGKYYLGKSNTFEEHAEVYFQYKNPESYHVNLEPIKDIGSQWRLYKVNRVLIKNRNVEFN
ncbi:hypothetical protein KJ765_05825 [Candidatus Micrarchaeota archaeon]|nr:hypothetical protein [Candidatus Micrarchaeota archaeon]